MLQNNSRPFTAQVTAIRCGLILTLIAGSATLAGADPTLPEIEPQHRIDWIRNATAASGSDVESHLVAMARQDECEAVRFEAVLALRARLALAAGVPESRVVAMPSPCPSRPRGLIGRFLSRVFGTPRSQQMVAVTVPMIGTPVAAMSTCCESATRDALLTIAAGRDAEGRPHEPSPRIRAAASEALALCEQLGACEETTPGGSPRDFPPRRHPKHGHDGPLIEEPPAGFEPLALK